MKKVSCSSCSLDAIFKSKCDQFKACPKHYFSLQAQGYELERIKIPINNESKEILYRFLVTIELKFISRINQILENDDKEYKNSLTQLKEALINCGNIWLFLMRKNYVLMKLIFSPFEYFLIQPKEKTLKYIKENWNRVILLEFRRSVKAHLYDFNYFKFEDQKYNHGWVYKSAYNKPRLSLFCGTIFLDFIKISEYEMAYELYQNLLSYLEFYDHPSIKMIKYILNLFGNILKKIIEKESIEQPCKLWKAYKTIYKLIENPADKSSKKLEFLLYFILDHVISIASGDKSISGDFCEILLQAERFCENYDKSAGIRICQERGLFYYNNKNYKESIECFMKSINYYKKQLCDDSLELLIEAYRYLAKAHSALKNNKEIKEILEIIEDKCSSTQDKCLFYTTIGEIYYLLNNFDKASKIIWKYIKMSKPKNFINSYELSNLWISLADIQIWKGDFYKAHKFLFNAKSLCSILPITDPNEQEINKALGVFYLNSQRYEEALKYFERITNQWFKHELLFAKFSMGIAYFWMLNFEKAWELLTEAQKKMLEFNESYKNQLFIVNAFIGELCYLKGNLEEADRCFDEAFNLIDHYDVFKIDFFLKSSIFVFSHFYEKSSYETCRVILIRINKILENNDHLKFRMPCYFIMRAKLHISLNEMKEAGKWLSEAEKLLNIDKILYISQKSIKINDLDCMSDYIELAKIYINLFKISNGKYAKAEKILKYSEEVVNTVRLNDKFLKLELYYWLGALYLKEQRWEESRRYTQQSLYLYKDFNHNWRQWEILMKDYLKLMEHWNFMAKRQLNIQ